MTTFVKTNDVPPFARYDGADSFFGGQPPLSENIGYVRTGTGTGSWRQHQFLPSFLPSFGIQSMEILTCCCSCSCCCCACVRVQIVVLGFGVIFSIFTTLAVAINNRFGSYSVVTSEYFK